MVRASDLADLPVNEKLQLVTELWDQIAAVRQISVLPDWVDDEADRRLEKMHRDASTCMTEEELWRRVDDSR
ncbi:MAG: addiction module protein [Planctomycetota bacterium]